MGGPAWYTAHGIPTARQALLFRRCQRTAMNAGLTPGWRAFLLRGLHDHWDDVELDRQRSQSLADPTDVTAPPKHRQVWLTAASAERITGQQGWQLALLPAAIDQDARDRPLRHLFRLQAFRKPDMNLTEQSAHQDGQCCVLVYWGGELVDEVRYVPVDKGSDEKLCATCVVPCADGTGGICGKQNTFRNVVNSHLRKTHKLTNEDAQRLLASLGLSAPMTVTNTHVYHHHGSLQGQGAADEYAAGDAGWSGVSHPPMAAGQPIIFAGSVIYQSSHVPAAETPTTDDESAPPPLGLLRVDDMDMAPSNSDLNGGIAPSYLQGHETLLGHEVGGLMQQQVACR
ncbi:unnamed protein product [Vitrella brassicaformis CCMP3155]|uniref:Uncharacterized protein n=1 Tax=Vitrella brassicaformis (strain CCMP3155) TaxID=1169540 RepID=A0A0G4GEW2_VITBC|nr:unnamed protein product [Vitrella brassicaformis CCMP3155]|eukprot:CEM28000.1 unnamed protein product [Vitrella brassicaformis CCMP3155]